MLTISLPWDCVAGFIEGMCDYRGGGHVKLSGRFKVLDVGANVGGFTLYAVNEWPGCEVVAYEPNPVVFKFLAQNCAGISRVWCVNAAVGSLEKKWLVSHPENPLMNYTAVEKPDGLEAAEVAVTDPSTWPIETHFDVVKLDCEGDEVEVLPRLRFTPRVLFVETHSVEARRFTDEWAHAAGLSKIHCRVNNPDIELSTYARET